MDILLKSEHFQPSHTNPVHSETFPRKKFFAGVSDRYTEYARQLSQKLGISCDILLGFIFIFVRAAVHYAMFEDEYYLKMQMKVLKGSVFSILNHNDGGKTS